MKIVVTARTEGTQAQVDPRFGRAAWFVAVDTDTGAAESVSNRAGVQAAQGAGTQAVQTIAGLGAQCLITGDIGPKAFSALEAAGIKPFIGAEGTVSEAIEAFAEGRLRQADGPGHPGHPW